MSFDLDVAWRPHDQVSVRPERFGALLYHFGTRRLSFVKSPELLAVLTQLSSAPTAREACRRAGIDDADLFTYEQALARLAATDMLVRAPDIEVEAS